MTLVSFKPIGPVAPKSIRFGTADRSDKSQELVALKQEIEGEQKVTLSAGLVKELAGRMNILGQLLVKKPDMARPTIELAIKLYQALLQHNVTDIGEVHIVQSQLVLGQVLLAERKPEEAKVLIEGARKYYEQKNEQSSEAARAFELLDTIYRQLRDRKMARYCRTRAKAIRDFLGS